MDSVIGSSLDGSIHTSSSKVYPLALQSRIREEKKRAQLAVGPLLGIWLPDLGSNQGPTD
jgi:hypothetical protein